MSFHGVELPKDAEGREIPLSTETMYFLDGEIARVRTIEFWPYFHKWRVTIGEKYIHREPSDLLLFPPDSWEQLEHDTTLAPRDYLQARGLEEHKDGRIATMMTDLVIRAKALAEREKNAE